MIDTAAQAQQALVQLYPVRKGYAVGRRALPSATPDARELTRAWKDAQGHHPTVRISRLDKCQAIVNLMGMRPDQDLAGSERWSTANDAWQGWEVHRHPTRNMAMFWIYSPEGTVKRVEILGGSRQDVEELRQHLVEWGLRPRQD